MSGEITDNELLSMIEESEDAFLELIKRYTPLVNIIVNKYKEKGVGLGLEITDIYQEGLIGLINAIRTYNTNKDASFKTYANIIIERTIIDLIKENNRIKFKTLNSAISLDKLNEVGETNLYNKIEISIPSIEKRLIDIEETEELKQKLTEFELKVFELKMDGKTNKEISIILDKPSRSIENTIQRIKTKIKEMN